MMLKWIFAPVFHSEPAVFVSDFSLEESVERLRRVTSRSILLTLFRQAAAGKVRADKVKLQRAIPFFGNSYKPFFSGRFINRDGVIVLSGKFAIHEFAKLFMIVWLGFAVAWTMFSCLFAAVWLINPSKSLEDPSYWFPFAGAAFVIAGRYFVKFCWWLSSSDIKYLSRVIQESLGSDDGPARPHQAAPDSGDSIRNSESPHLIVRR